MSLLNNALREAEERQRRPDVTGAYTGAVEEGRGVQCWLVVLILLLALGLAGAGIYWFTGTNPSPVEASRVQAEATAETQTQRQASEPESSMSSGDSATQGQVERQPPVIAKVAEPEPALPDEPPVPEPAPELVPEKEPASEPEKPESPEPDRPAPESPAKVAAAEEPEPEPAPEQAPAVKTKPQSPEAIDRQAAKEIETLIASGRMVEAERQLNDLARTQSAPRSRYTVARALLVDGETRRSLDWLPEDVAAKDATLRMLRARAQHADGRLDAAVATLESSVPAVAEQAEYRVTLATLLQQQGENEKAAAHWAELIAWDDSRAPWWVGLAIALEDQGEIGGATRAYEQAAALPGLPPSLADYVQRRLQSLRAG